MEFMVKEDNLRNAEDRLRQHSGRRDEIQSALQDCRRELRRLIPMSAELMQLDRIIDRVSSETRTEERMTDALSAIMNTYLNNEKNAEENAMGSLYFIAYPILNPVRIPHYDFNIVRFRESLFSEAGRLTRWEKK